MRTVLRNPVVQVAFICFFLNVMVLQTLPAPVSASFITREWEDFTDHGKAKEGEIQAKPKQDVEEKAVVPEMTSDPFIRVQDVQTATHLAGSHFGLVMRPVSFIYRLAFMVLHTGVDALKWTWRIGLDGKPVPRLSDRPGMDLGAWEEELDRITGSVSSTGTMNYLIDGWQFFPKLEEALNKAEESIDIRTYIFDNDDYAIKIAELLKRRSRETDVRVLLDGLGTILATKADPDSIPHEHDAPSSMRVFLKTGSRVKVRQQLNPFFTFDHTKTTIIDHKLAYIGGMNIGREYRYDWHDLMVELRGPVVSSLEREFDKAWAYAGFWGDLGKLASSLKTRKKGPAADGIPLRVLYTRTDDSEIYNAQLEAIRRASRYIYIQNAYFSDDAILYELARARRRGVDVRVILPAEGNWSTMNASNVLAMNAMLANGVRVFLYPGMSHVKAAVYDGWACLGSANFDKASLRFNGEINVATSHPETVNKLIDRLFRPDFAVSVELKESVPNKPSDYLAELLADLL
ncbi:phosphatidylserine/phosphatidylglycerophosphate/cardiolipin synthase family protein [bacterium]|nr:MAG: phosphatidylserine/phosphatidylglycerophosphate/cardiolipin synthase family protein [bacterium]